MLAAHGVGGATGALLTGVLAQKSWNGTADGALFGNLPQLGIQAVAVLATIAYCGAGTWVIVQALGAVTALRASPKEEGLGLDVTQHGEEAYSRLEGAILVQERPTAEHALRNPILVDQREIVGGAAL